MIRFLFMMTAAFAVCCSWPGSKGPEQIDPQEVLGEIGQNFDEEESPGDPERVAQAGTPAATDAVEVETSTEPEQVAQATTSATDAAGTSPNVVEVEPPTQTVREIAQRVFNVRDNLTKHCPEEGDADDVAIAYFPELNPKEAPDGYQPIVGHYFHRYRPNLEWGTGSFWFCSDDGDQEWIITWGTFTEGGVMLYQPVHYVNGRWTEQKDSKGNVKPAVIVDPDCFAELKSGRFAPSTDKCPAYRCETGSRYACEPNIKQQKRLASLD